MSIEVTKLIRRHAKQHKSLRGGRLAVLLALSEHAHKDGSKAHPGIPKLADETMLTERQVRRCLRELEKLAFIFADERPGRFTVYCIDLEVLEGRTKCPAGHLRR